MEVPIACLFELWDPSSRFYFSDLPKDLEAPVVSTCHPPGRNLCRGRSTKASRRVTRLREPIERRSGSARKAAE